MSTLLRLRGLPFSCTEEEVLGFFEGSGKAVAVHLGTKNGGCGGARGVAATQGGGPGAAQGVPGCASVNGRARDETSPCVAFPHPPGKRSGEGYAEFETPEDAQKALTEKQHAHLSTRYIE